MMKDDDEWWFLIANLQIKSLKSFMEYPGTAFIRGIWFANQMAKSSRRSQTKFHEWRTTRESRVTKETLRISALPQKQKQPTRVH